MKNKIYHTFIQCMCANPKIIFQYYFFRYHLERERERENPTQRCAIHLRVFEMTQQFKKMRAKLSYCVIDAIFYL